MRGLPLHGLLAAGARLVGRATAAGRLLDLGPYPGLVAGPGRVRGELYRLEAPGLLPVLDRAEGPRFARGRTLVTRPGGGRARAWVYRYVGPPGGAPAVAGGDWRRRRAGRRTISHSRATGGADGADRR